MRGIAFILALSLALTLAPEQIYGQENSYSPYYAKMQYAGSIGLVSVGAGRTFFNEKLDAELFLGYLPERVGGEELWTAAFKTHFVPIRPIQVGALDWQPLRTGLMINYTFGDDYFIFGHHDKYPKGYYGHPTAMHLYLVLGGQLDFTRTTKLGRLGFYYEVNSSAEYLISYVRNTGYLSPGKIFNLALGVRLRL